MSMTCYELQLRLLAEGVRTSPGLLIFMHETLPWVGPRKEVLGPSLASSTEFPALNVWEEQARPGTLHI